MKTPPSQSSPFVYWHLAAIALLCILVYANTLGGAFVWDDETQIIKNPTIRSLSNIPAAFTKPFWSFVMTGGENQTNFYRPLQTVIYTLGYAASGLSPTAYHVINIGLHMVASIFLYLIAIRWRYTPDVALLAAGLFAVHPIHTEAVAWIGGAPDVACGAFYFAAVWAFLKSGNGKHVAWVYASAALFLGALFSKEMAITLPLLLLFITFYKDRIFLTVSGIIRTFAPYAVAMIVYFAMRAHALGFLTSVPRDVQADSIDWITAGFQVFAQYIRYALVPYPLIAFRLVPIHFADRGTTTAIAFVLVAAFAFAVWRLRRKFPDAAFWFTAFALLLIPVFYFKGISITLMADRYLYIPSAAMMLCVAALIAQTNSKQALAAAWVVALAFSALTIKRNPDWSSSESIYSQTLADEPDAAYIQLSLSDILLQRNEDASVRQHLETALTALDKDTYMQSATDRYRAHIGLGALDARAGKFADARAHLETALHYNPAGDWGYLYLGGIAMEADNDYPKAVALFQKAISLSPVNDVARDYLGIALMNQGNAAGAAEQFREALKINPENPDAKAHLELALRPQPAPAP